MTATGDPGEDGLRRRAAGALGLTVLIAVLGWDAPRVLGAGAGTLGCVVLVASAGTLSGLIVSRPGRWVALFVLVAVMLVGAACSLSVLHVGRAEI